ncbi:MAG: LysR family transcriptional regulator [Rhodobacteraceae bacterium]|nr:LysR family transcriptional regulator [Paracoccaceae bacterium]PHR55890.1 MAG: LysR family transcriptional regulator [Robiginitomaculum sp.]
MDIKQLRYFQAIVDEGSFSAAAHRLRIAQPALSKHVQRMELELGVTLLLRRPTGIVPTEAGALLAKRGRTILADLNRIKDDVRSIGQVPTGTVRLGLPGTISAILSVPLITKCLQLYPNIKIIIAEAMSGFVEEWLLEGRVDIALLYTKMAERNVASERMLDEQLFLIAPNHFPMPQIVRLSDLIAAPVILPSGSHGLRKLVNAQLKARRLAVEPVIEVDSYESIIRLVAGGHGQSVLPLNAVSQHAKAQAFSIRQFSAQDLSRTAYITKLSDRPETRAGQVVEELLRAVVEELVTDNIWQGASIGG